MSQAYSDWIQIVTWEVHTAEMQKEELATKDNGPLIWNSECMHVITFSSKILIIFDILFASNHQFQGHSYIGISETTLSCKGHQSTNDI